MIGIEALQKNQCYINGEWVDAQSGQSLEVTNPATGEVVGQVPDMGVEETKQAIEAAHTAWLDFRNTTAPYRAGLLKKWFQLIEEHKAELGKLMTMEQGKPLAEAIGEMNYANSFIEWFAEEARRAYGDTIPAPSADKRIWVLKQSVGVCGLITPWNFPAAMITRKAAPAIAAGCTVVIKPASLTPLSALALVVLAEKAGFPKGVINIVTGKNSAAIGTELTTNEMVRKISFTGSTYIGSMLMQQSAGQVMKVSMELGGNAPFVVFEDADIDAAVEGAIAAKYRNAGQACISANRFIVQDSIADEFAKRLAKASTALKVGNGLEEGVLIGPLVNQAAFDSMSDFVEDARSKGAKVLCGGQPHALGGYFYEPTVLCHVTTTSKCFREEIFGPIAPITTFKTEEEAIALANETEFGLAAYFYTENLNRAHRVSEAIESGMIGINTGAISTTVAPFGGVKRSGVGREGSHQGMDEFMETKYVCLGNVK